MNDRVTAFCDAVTELSVANARRRAWWYTWLASRDRFRTNLFALFVGRDDSTDSSVSSGGALQIAKEIAAAVQGRLAAIRHPAAAPVGTDVVIVAPASAPALSNMSAPYRDTYFGTLQETLRSGGETPALVGIPVTTRSRTVAALARRRDLPASSIYHWLRFPDIVHALFETAKMRIDCPPDGLPREAAAVIRTEKLQMKAEMFSGLLVERAIRRLLAACPDARVIHTYENNPWEHAVDHAAHEAIPPRHVIGYLHCAVLPSHLKNYMAPEEARIRPQPDVIVCTGPAARDVFLGLGHHEPERVRSGCALRDPDIASATVRTAPPIPVETVLVVLEGLRSMTDVIRFLDVARKFAEGRRILIRAHPVMPLPKLLDEAGVQLEPAAGFDESRQPSLDAAIEEADAVVFVSSTAAMKALIMGRPLIKVKLHDVLEDDPLFACSALKEIIRRPEELEIAIRKFEQMTLSDFERDLTTARAYLSAYMAPPTKDALTAFRISAPAAAQFRAI